MSKRRIDYPLDWETTAKAVKDAAGWCCIRCGHPHDRPSGHVLTVHHLDRKPMNCAWHNLVALCQRCHLRIQVKVVIDRPWVMTEHAEWFQPYVAGFYARKYLGIELTREETMARLDELLSLERLAMGMAVPVQVVTA